MYGSLYFLDQGYEDARESSSPLSPFINNIVEALLDAAHREDASESRIWTAACETSNEVEHAGESSSPLSPFFKNIVEALLSAAHREDASESRLRTATYETLNEVLQCSTKDNSYYYASCSCHHA